MTEVQYSLYHSKKEVSIKIKRHNKPQYKLSYDKKELDAYNNGEVAYYNDCYYICKDRKKLKDLAIKLKNDWITEKKSELDKLESIKI